MEIRQLNGQDAKKYLGIRHDGLRLNPEAFGSSYEEEVKLGEDFYRDRLNSKSNYTFGAFVGEDLVGVVSLVPERKLKMRHRANIYAMFVNPNSREQGIGKRLMKKAIEKAKDLGGIEQIYLSVTAKNDPARHLYASLGFEVYGLDPKALRVGKDYFDEELRVLFFKV